MRKLLFVFTAFLPTLSMAQAVDHFTNEDSEWNVARVHPNASPEFPYFVEIRSTYYAFLGDTVINGNTWLKLYSSWDTLYNLNLQFKGLIRSSEGVVLFRDLNFDFDTLYNFNLNIGDSVYFNFPYPLDPQNIAVIDIDSIQINGLYFKRFFFDEPAGPNAFDIFNEVWIEGIGSLHGPVFPNQPRKFATEWPDKLDLTCTFSEGIQYWNDPAYNNCFINIILGLNDPSLTEYKIYPNPFKDFIIIENGNVKSGLSEVEIYNIQGNKIYSGKLSNDKQKIILDHLTPGVYYVRVNQGSNYNSRAVVKLY